MKDQAALQADQLAVRELEHRVMLLTEELKRSKFREEQWYKLCLLESQRAAALYRMLGRHHPLEEFPSTSDSTRG